MTGVPGVKGVHDLHILTITSGLDALRLMWQFQLERIGMQCWAASNRFYEID